MKIIAMIPARYEASRFPGKLMKTLGDAPVIVQTYRATLQTQLFDDVFVVTDSELIFDTIVAAGGKALMSRLDHQSGSDRIAEAVHDMDVDLIVNVQGDEPFAEKRSLEKLIASFNTDFKKEIDLASLMVKITDPKEIQNPNTVKVITDQRGLAIYFSRHAIPFSRDNSDETQFFKHKGVYAFRKQALLDFQKLEPQMLELSEKIECLRFLENGRKIQMVETDVLGIEIDTPEDLEEAQKVWNSNKLS
ncbi:MAG: 3-deoxy-manno-octulosonate cytidylyltransferase [Flavobacteriaceae bacterium]